MQIHLEGSNAINADRGTVFRLLTDPNFLAKTLPDAEDVHVVDEKSLEAKVKLKLAVVSSTMKTRLTISEAQAPSMATLLAEGSGTGSNLKIVSKFELQGDRPTTMKWSADADITGVMAGLGSSLLKGFATKKVAEIFNGITGAIESSTQ